MNKKIKVFDLIEMFYRKEKMPQKIKVSCYEFEYDEEINAYFNLDKNSNNNSLIQDWLNNASKLNNEVEILEDNTEEIKEFKIDENGFIKTNNGTWKGRKLDVAFANKINQLIREINKLKENK